MRCVLLFLLVSGCAITTGDNNSTEIEVGCDISDVGKTNEVPRRTTNTNN